MDKTIKTTIGDIVQAVANIKSKPVAQGLPDYALKAIEEGRCPLCSSQCSEFRNELSLLEYKISGMCQECQDSFFGKD
jgi:hypothetical protein